MDNVLYLPWAATNDEIPKKDLFGVDAAEKVRHFHKGFDEYAPTPLVSLNALAHETGVAGLYVKDESKRFGLNAFKVLGGSYAIGSLLAAKLNIPVDETTCHYLMNPENRNKSGNLTFVTATDGNHGRGVAWTARQLGYDCYVYLPKGTVSERLANIRKLGAYASITEMSYDDTVRFAREQAACNNWIQVQDTEWEGYSDIPAMIMQGYTTIGSEIREQLHSVTPTHIILQAGVGSMAGALTAYSADCFSHTLPRIIIVEPKKADCFYRTAYADDGNLHAVTGPMDTIMAGLACGEPCRMAWEIIKRRASGFAAIDDETAALGMRVLGNPMGEDERIISGESGASGFGLVMQALLHDLALKDKLGLNRDSRVLVISTEGDTDRENYRNIVWNGKYPSGKQPE